ncbi:MAG: naphthalene 1,2-dioxygenase ferredoxin component [Chloroflexota bacterium]|nr:naphthalene 1,2-dioxygenase ferredoxin component [Chloroflexota bacterium]
MPSSCCCSSLAYGSWLVKTGGCEERQYRIALSQATRRPRDKECHTPDAIPGGLSPTHQELLSSVGSARLFASSAAHAYGMLLAGLPPSATGQSQIRGMRITDSAGDDFVAVAQADEVPDGAIKEVEIDENVLVLVHAAGRYYALSAWCTHLGSNLVLGQLTDHVVTCWAHLWQFDVRTGEPLRPPLAKIAPGYRLRTYPVRVDGGTVYVSRKPGRPNLG